jgi:cobalt-zinc-cadmium efflux system membrane fusion protein
MTQTPDATKGRETSPVTEPLSLGQRRLMLISVACGACAVAALAIAVSYQPSAASRPAPPFAVTEERVEIQRDAPTWGYIELAAAAVGEAILPHPVPGRVAFDDARAVPVVAPLAGRVDAVAVRLGQQVEQGERLLAVRSAALVDLSKEIDLLRAEESARAKAVERSKALLQVKALPEKDLIAAEQDLRQSRLAREAAELKLRSLSVAREDDGHYWVTAPRGGVIVERSVLIGQEVSPERGEPLLVIADLDEVIVTADVAEPNVAGVQVGQQATVLPSAAPEHTLTGQVEYVGAVVDPVRHMVTVRVRVPNPDHGLRPNGFVQVAFAPDRQPRVIIDASAVVSDDQRSFVFVQTPDRPQSLQRRAVVPGRQREGRVEILSGLGPGETYVRKGALLLLNALDLAS